jgi:hypothetical protein
MSFWLCNASTTFMCVMNIVFRPFLDDFVIVYLDDILIFNRIWDEHVRHVRKVLDTFQRENMYVKLSKCEFGKIALVYLGHIVGGGQLKIPTYFHLLKHQIINYVAAYPWSYGYCFS